jgi:hypothetical protein
VEVLEAAILKHPPADHSARGSASMTVLADDSRAVKAELVANFSARVDELFAIADSPQDLRSLEKAVVAELLSLGQLALGYLLALRCRRATEKDLSERGLKSAQVRLRFDADYCGSMMTTVGQVHFPLFSYREEVSGASVTRTPARESVVPYRGCCRSSPLCLEWELRLGAQSPFRRAENELAFFTHGATTVEDTTISRHLVQISKLVDRKWTYLSREEIREILRERATRDRKNGKPVVYASCDAHALRRYTDDTWAFEWKMVNGIRLWCEDRDSGEVIHLGGEFTWGDCHEVGRAFAALIEMGVLPRKGDYGDGIRAQLVWVSDAMRWFDEHILRLFPDAIVVLDIFHLLRWFAVLGAKLFGAATQRSRQVYAQAAKALGFQLVGDKPEKVRCGHKKHPRRSHRHAHEQHVASRFPGLRRSGKALAMLLLRILASIKTATTAHTEEVEKVAERLSNNVLRMDYVEYLQRGYQIGSGAMESLHRSGSQCRTKLPGARWLKETSQAVFNIRMMQLVGKWEEFWARPELVTELTAIFSSAAVSTSVVLGG